MSTFPAEAAPGGDAAAGHEPRDALPPAACRRRELEHLQFYEVVDDAVDGLAREVELASDVGDAEAARAGDDPEHPQAGMRQRELRGCAAAQACDPGMQLHERVEPGDGGHSAGVSVLEEL